MDTTRELEPRSTTRHDRRRRRLLCAPLVALLLATAVMTGDVVTDPLPAAAATQQATGGSPGYYTVGKVRASKTYDAVGGRYSVTLSIDGPTISRSPAIAGTQHVIVHTVLYKYNTRTGWGAYSNRQSTGALTTGSMTMWPHTFGQLDPGYYYIMQYVVWGSSNWVRVDYNHQSDFVCTPSFDTFCTPYSQGYVYVHWV